MTQGTEKAGVLDPADVERFEREGYLVIDSVDVPEGTLDSIVAELAHLYGGQMRNEGGVVYFRNRIMDAWKINEHVKALALAPNVLAILEQLYGRRPLPFQTINFRTGTQQATHSDAMHFNSMPPGFMCGVWVALEDIDMDNGPLFYYPGSQKLPEVNMQDVGVDAAHSEYPHYEKYIDDLIQKHSLEPEYALLKKGQALVWSSNILHGGAPQKDLSRSRHSQVTHFFFEGCRYYTPLMSKDVEAGDIDWRDPDWIR
jgi:ectoine hydroxylase-related dioxygenase (phytanoyl-CoA dioxygenase family)